MRIRWRNFELPSTVEVEQATLSERFAKFTIEPFEKGFGHTIGNGLRRVLLSSIEGTAVESMRIEGVMHEFTTIPGVLEDVTDIVLNLKGLLVALDEQEHAELRLSRNKKGPLAAGQIQAPAHVRILNPDHLLCTLTEDVEVTIVLTVGRGRGYVTAEEHAGEHQVLGIIDIDSNYTPVERVRYRIEETRVGKITNYDRLVLEIWTDGTVRPEDALVEASLIYRKHLNAFVHFRDLGSVVVADEVQLLPAGVTGTEREKMRQILATPIEDLDLSVRSRHCLDSENIANVGQLVQRSEVELLKVRNFGTTSLAEVKKKLTALGLQLGMALDADLAENVGSRG